MNRADRPAAWAAHTDWMAALPDRVSPATLSIPGTHDTMARRAPRTLRTQDLDLSAQLRAGVRAVDIRLRHLGDRLPVHHGPAYLHADFTDVLTACTEFLAAHPGETLLMRIAAEHTARPAGRDFAAVVRAHLDRHPGTAPAGADRLWRPPAGAATLPPLGAVRGRIVLLPDYPSPAPMGIVWGGPATAIQDHYRLPIGVAAATAAKWAAVHAQLRAAADGPDGMLFVNHLSGRIGRRRLRPWDRPTPHDLAVGTAARPGLVPRTAAFLRARPARRTGVVFADFPSPELVAVILAGNPL